MVDREKTGKSKRIKWRMHCSTCGVEYDAPRKWAYCSKRCEINRRGRVYRQWLDAKSATAQRSYQRAISRFAAWALGGVGRAPEASIPVLMEAGRKRAHAMVNGWLAELLNEGLAPGTVAGACTAISSLVHACRGAGLCDWTLEGLAPRPERIRDLRGPRRADVEQLIAFVDSQADLARTATRRRRSARDAAVLRLLHSAELMRSEVTQLRVEDVDLSAPCVRPRRKGKREREAVSISAGTAAALHRWLELRGATPGWLFTRTDRGDDSVPIAGETIRRMLTAWAERAGLRGAIRPHGLRKSAASWVEHGDVDIALNPKAVTKSPPTTYATKEREELPAMHTGQVGTVEIVRSMQALVTRLEKLVAGGAAVVELIALSAEIRALSEQAVRSVLRVNHEVAGGVA